MSSRLRALLLASDLEIESAANELVWRDHQVVVESLSNARELIACAIDHLGHPDDPEELDFDV